jgi:hypothetical protein
MENEKLRMENEEGRMLNEEGRTRQKCEREN